MALVLGLGLGLLERAIQPPSLSLDFLSTTTLDSRITFTRGSNATLTGSTGKVTYAPANLLTYSQEFDNAAWVKASVGITANAATAPDGSATADKTYPTVSDGRVYQSATTPGLSVLSFYVKAGEMAAVNIRAPDNGPAAIAYLNLSTGVVSGVNASYGSAGAVAVGNGWYRFYFYLLAAVTNISFAPCDAVGSTASTPSGTNGIYIWGAQLEPVTYQTTPGTYQATTASAYYGPRFDYDPVTLAAKGLLIEEARTNLALQSGNLANAAWVATNATASANATTAPDGTNTAASITATTADPVITQTISVTAVANTTSLYVKGSASTIGKTVRVWMWYSGTATGTNAPVSITLTANWQRVTAVSTPTGAGTVLFRFDAAGVASVNDVFYVWGAQLEAGAFATSYIPTVASTVTRSADVATMTGTNFSSWYNQSAGTLVVQFDAADANGTVMTVSDGTAANRLVYYPASATQFEVITASVSQGSLDGGTVALNTATKVASAYATNDLALSLSGGAVVTDTSATIPSVSQLRLAASAAGGAILNGHIQTIAYFNTRLANAQLQSLTA